MNYNPDYMIPKRYIIMLVLVIAGVLGCTARDFEAQAETRIRNLLPTGAVKIQDAGNGWKTFEIDRGPAAGCYLYKSESFGAKGKGFMTLIGCG